MSNSSGSTFVGLAPFMVGDRTPMVDRASVRVIWGRALGSTYQRYRDRWEADSSGNGGSEADPGTEDNNSAFSCPLSCPSCRGSLDIRQAGRGSPDHLVGTCLGCSARFLLDVVEQGRIYPIELRDPTAADPGPILDESNRLQNTVTT